MTLHVTIKGGPGSGNFGHSGRPGMVGGSGGGGKVASVAALEALFNDGIESGAWIDARHAERSEVKDAVVADLSQRSGIDVGTTNAFVKQWAQSSNDEDMRSLAMQKDAAAEFGISVSEFTQDKIDFLSVGSGEASRPLMESEDQRKILRSMYENTQQKLQEAGYAPDDKITLYRGMSFLERNVPDAIRLDVKEGRIVQVSGNPLESWSIDTNVARNFAAVPPKGYVGIVLKMDVPVKNIVSTAKTGLGCLTEGEVVTMGSIVGDAQVAITVVTDSGKWIWSDMPWH